MTAPYTRLNDKRTGAIVIIMRLHQDDPDDVYIVPSANRPVPDNADPQ